MTNAHSKFTRDTEAANDAKRNSDSRQCDGCGLSWEFLEYYEPLNKRYCKDCLAYVKARNDPARLRRS